MTMQHKFTTHDFCEKCQQPAVVLYRLGLTTCIGSKLVLGRKLLHAGFVTVPVIDFYRSDFGDIQIVGV